MKRVFMSFLIFGLCFVLIACQSQTANAQVSRQINTAIDIMSNTIKEVQSINEEDILITQIIPSTYTAIINPANGNNSTNQIVNYGYSPTNAMRNVNTYNAYGRNHNVNSYAGYGETNQVMFNEINQAQYGMGGMGYGYGMPGNSMYNYGNMPYGNFNGFGYGNGYGNGLGYGNGIGYGNAFGNGFNRGISNVNTYGMYKTNVNTYNPNLINQEIATEENATTNTNTKSNSNINTYNNAQTDNEDYTAYEENENLSNQFSALSNLYSNASSVVYVNSAINEQKTYILSTVDEIKELSKQLSENETSLTASQKSSINNLIENINSNLNKIKLSKNEVRYELEKIKSMKNNYQSKTEQLSSRYVRLTNVLDTRYSYYCNISSCLNQLKAYLNFYNGNYVYEDEEILEEEITQITEDEQTDNTQDDEIQNNSESTNFTDVNNLTNDDEDIILENDLKKQNEEFAKAKTLQEKLNKSKNSGDSTSFYEDDTRTKKAKTNQQEIQDGFKNYQTDAKQVKNEMSLFPYKEPKKFDFLQFQNLSLTPKPRDEDQIKQNKNQKIKDNKVIKEKDENSQIPVIKHIEVAKY